MAETDSFTVRVCEFATNRSFDVQLTAQSSVSMLKKSISQLHERKPDESIQKVCTSACLLKGLYISNKRDTLTGVLQSKCTRGLFVSADLTRLQLVLLGKPLNDPNATVVDIMRGKGIDPAETRTTIHLMLAEPAPTSIPAASDTSSQDQTIRRRFTAGEGGSSGPQMSTGAARPGAPDYTSQASSSAPQPIAQTAPQTNTTQAAPAAQPDASTAPNSANHSSSQSASAQALTQPTASDPIMMHPIMAAAYNAALCELANGNMDSSGLSAVFPQHAGEGTRTIPLAVPAPLHFNPQYGGPRSQPPTIVINTQNLHLDGNNANSLRSILSRQNVHLQPPGAGGRRGAAAQRQRDGQGRGAAGAGGGAGAREEGAGGFRRDPDGVLRLQMQFHFNLMGVARGILTVVFMHMILGLSLMTVVALVGAYFLMRALLRLNLHRGVARWFDGVAANLLQPPPGLAAGPPAGAAAADGAAAAPGEAPAAAAPQPYATLRALVAGLLSFFLSLLPQFNADGADAEAIAAAQEDLNNQGDNGAAMAF